MRGLEKKARELKTGVPTGRTGDELNQGLRPEEDAWRHPRGSFCYEWWYFDATFTNGYSTVVIVWPMNYGKPWRRQYTLQFSIYTPEGECIKHYLFPPRFLFSASLETCDLSLGRCYIRGAHPSYELFVDLEDIGARLTFEAEIPGWKPGTGENLVLFPRRPIPRYRVMGWLVPLPRARVRGTLRVRGEEMEVEGQGYHDHNWGEVPLFHLVDNWHWGHLVSGETTIIWADITMDRSLDYDRTFMFLLAHRDRLVYESPELIIRYSDWVENPLYLHPYPGTITVGFGAEEDLDRGEFTMEVREVVETQDLLEYQGIIPRSLHGLVHRFIAKPFYCRWRSAVRGWAEIEGKREQLQGETIHEQMLLRGRFLRGWENNP